MAERGLSLLNRGTQGSQNKTVTFGDSSAVRSKPLWSLFALVLLLGFWWLATNPFGFDEDGSFRATVDEQFIANYDESAQRIDADIADKGFSNLTLPVREPNTKEYLAECQLAWGSAQSDAADQLEDEGIDPDAADFNDQVDERAATFAACNTNDYSQLLSPRNLPSPGDTWTQFGRLRDRGFQNFSLWVHTRDSLWRVLQGMFWGIVAGVPIGMAMGLSSRLRGFFDTPVELFRPIPPLAILPLFILWFGVDDPTPRNLLIFAAIWIMIISARSGASTVQLSKVRAAYSLGASKRQLLMRVILPNALPELFTGARVALGVCWGTLVAAELVGADTGLGSMIFQARANLRSDVVVVGIIIIALIGVAMDIIMRFLESKLIPWRGKG